MATAIAAAGLGGLSASSAHAQNLNSQDVAAKATAVATDKTPCTVSLDRVKITLPLVHTGHKLAAGEAITIVALGSSSTAGAGATSSAASYPSQLEKNLSTQFPRSQIKIINRGVNGDEAPDMMARLKDGVLSEKPDLVLWQLGTNAVLRDKPMSDYDILVQRGVEQLKAIGSDVVLIDLQYAPKVIAKMQAAENMVDFIGTMTKRENIGWFHRFAMMKAWHLDERIPVDKFISADGVHMNDWGYACLAKTLAVAIADAATRPLATVSAVKSPH